MKNLIFTMKLLHFLISISSKKVIPYIEKTLFTESKIDDEILY